MSKLSEFYAKFWFEHDGPEAMWDSWHAPHRRHLNHALRCIPAFQSLYEIGCGAGPNLRGIQQAYPDVRLGGSEPNPVYATWASEHLSVPIDQTKLPTVPSDPWDVVLTSYTLTYAEPQDVYDALCQVRAQHLVIMEPSPFIAPFTNPGVYVIKDDLTMPQMPVQVHDYLELTRAAGWLLKWRWPIYPHYQGLNMILVAERA